MKHNISRRSFAKIGVGALTFGLASLQTSISGARIIGANDRIRCGFVGVANRGGQLIKAFREHDDMEVAALCDLDRKTLETAAEANGNPFTSEDYRKLLERDDIDAVVLATPDHWHALQMVDACKAGKDVFVEKPLSVTVREGRIMVEATQKYKRVVQVGLHRRSSRLQRELAEEGIENKVGRVTVARCYRASNMYPEGIGKAAPSEPPPGFNWDLWLGPRPLQPFQATIAPYKFRWWDLYSSQAANWGIHYLDVITWQLKELGPTSVSAMGGKFVIDDDRTIPDTLEVCFQFGNRRLAIFGQYEACGNSAMATDTAGRALGEVEFRGTQGTLYLMGGRYVIVPEQGGQFQERGLRVEAKTEPGYGENETLMGALHARNFLDCMRSRKQPNSDIESGHRSTTMSLIANISLALGQRLDWDVEKERFTNNDAANALLHYEYRAPWKLEI